jgi:hypothetical protein
MYKTIIKIKTHEELNEDDLLYLERQLNTALKQIQHHDAIIILDTEDYEAMR